MNSGDWARFYIHVQLQSSHQLSRWWHLLVLKSVSESPSRSMSHKLISQQQKLEMVCTQTEHEIQLCKDTWRAWNDMLRLYLLAFCCMLVWILSMSIIAPLIVIEMLFARITAFCSRLQFCSSVYFAVVSMLSVTITKQSIGISRRAVWSQRRSMLLRVLQA